MIPPPTEQLVLNQDSNSNALLVGAGGDIHTIKLLVYVLSSRAGSPTDGSPIQISVSPHITVQSLIDSITKNRLLPAIAEPRRYWKVKGSALEGYPRSATTLLYPSSHLQFDGAMIFGLTKQSRKQTMKATSWSDGDAVLVEAMFAGNWISDLPSL